jgi:hypothetical protein
MERDAEEFVYVSADTQAVYELIAAAHKQCVFLEGETESLMQHLRAARAEIEKQGIREMRVRTEVSGRVYTNGDHSLVVHAPGGEGSDLLRLACSLLATARSVLGNGRLIAAIRAENEELLASIAKLL